MTRTRSARYVAIAFVLTMNACGGSGHTVSPVAPVTPSAIGASAKRATITMTLTIPDVTVAAKRRLPAYVSSSTQSAAVIVNPGSTESDASLAPGATNCTAVPGGRSCSIPVSAPIGADTFAITLYDVPCNATPPCSVAGNALSAASGFAATIAEGQANITLPLVLGGIVQALGLAIAPDPGPVVSAQHDLAITLTAKDAQGNTIVGPAPFVDANGNASPLQLTALLSQTLNLTDPILLHNGTSVGATATIAGPTDTLALRVDAGGQTVLGTQMRVTSGTTTLPGSLYYQAPGPATGSLPASVSYGFSLSNNAISTLAPAAFGQTFANEVYAGSAGGWISNLSTSPGSDWAGQSVNTYCHLNTATNTEGIGVDTAGNAYVSFFDGSHSYYTEVPHGFANAVVPCSTVAGPFIFGASGNLGGAVAVSPSTIFFVNHLATSTPANDEEVDIVTPGLTSSAQLLIPPPGIIARGLAGAAVDPTDGSLWVAGHFTDEILHITGTPGVPTSYALAGSYPLGGCNPDGIVSDGVYLYVSCSSSGNTKIVTPNGTSAPTINTIGTIAGIGSVTSWNDIAIGPDGYLWILNNNSSIEKFNRATGIFLLSIVGGSHLTDLVVGGDGDLWLANNLANSNVYRFAQGVGP